jgi:hypothetical protein
VKAKAATKPKAKKTVTKHKAVRHPKPAAAPPPPAIQPAAPAPTVVDQGPRPTVTTGTHVASKSKGFPWIVLLLIPLALVVALILMSFRRGGPGAAERKRLREQRKMMRSGRAAARAVDKPEKEPAAPEADPDATFARSYVEWLDEH